MNKLIFRLLSTKFGAYFEIRILMRKTAGVFGMDELKDKGRSAVMSSAGELLKSYAEFTADASVRSVESGMDPERLHQMLYDMTYRLGSSLRRWMKPKDEKECFEILRLIYSNIGIEISEEGHRKFCVHKCYFSDFYTPQICRVISAIDQGIFAGIYKGGALDFRERITEGNAVCRADFKRERIS